MARYSKTLENIAKSDPRVSGYEFDSMDGGSHWLYLNKGYIHDGYEVHSIHEWKVSDVLHILNNEVAKCIDCPSGDCN